MNLTKQLATKIHSIDRNITFAESHPYAFPTNTDHMALCEYGDRQILTGVLRDNEEYYIHLVDRTVEAGTMETQNIQTIEKIIIDWLIRKKNIDEIKRRYTEFEINTYYIDVLTLSSSDLLQKQWTTCFRQVKKDSRFREDLLKSLYKTFYWLHVVFSHDVLCFSNIIDSNPNGGIYPCIHCQGDLIIISKNRDMTDRIVVSEIPEALTTLQQIIPWSAKDIVTPFGRNSA